jgi:DNA repair protein RecN (Recombination protein N)
MLKSIFIQNFALAHKLTIDFQNGLNMITGETGTGKSIIIGAISAVLGARMSNDVVRTGMDKATVEAIFDISGLPELQQVLQQKGLDGDKEIILRREISLKTPSRAFFNDTPITITTLSDIGDYLVDIHSQNEHQSLLKKEMHRYFLDAYGNLETHLKIVSEAYHKYQIARQALGQLQKRSHEMQNKYELYQFQHREIEKSHLLPEEDVQLEAERKILANSEKLFSISSRILEIIEGDDEHNLSNLMGQVLQHLKDLTEFSENFHEMANEVKSAQIIIGESSRSVEEFKNKLEFNPKRLEEIELRLTEILLLKKKYGRSISEILDYQKQLERDLNLQENLDMELESLKKKVAQEQESYQSAAVALSKARKKVAESLQNEIIDYLKEIGMPKIRFKVSFSLVESETGIYLQEGRTYRGDENGCDDVEFYISPNPGEDFKPLARIASGGEISRIMLALKNILADSDRIPLLIFDEIDAGVSGKIALSVGKSIRNLAETHQIICITHLPQIASFANIHYRVEKYIDNGRTFSKVNPLIGEDRVEEIASLMGGKNLTSEFIESARQLIQEAQNEFN